MQMQTYYFKGGHMGQSAYLYPGMNTLGLESIHINASNDELYCYNTEFYLSECPTRIVHDQGHKPPKYLEDEDILKFDNFIKR